MNDKKISMHNAETRKLGLTEQMVEDLRRARVLTKFVIRVKKSRLVKKSTISRTLQSSFRWSDTPEGFNFWAYKCSLLEGYDKLRNQTQDEKNFT